MHRFSKTLVFTSTYTLRGWEPFRDLFGTGRGQWRSKAEPSRAGPSRAEPSRAGPGRAGPSRADPVRAGPSRAEPSRAVPGRAEPSRAGPSRAEPGRAEPSRAEPSSTELSRRRILVSPSYPPGGLHGHGTLHDIKSQLPLK